MLLSVFAGNSSIVKLKKPEKINFINNIESKFHICINQSKLFFSNTCLLLSTNTRYEAFYLNINLRQRHGIGDLKCFILGSLINLTFPVYFLGSNFFIIKTIIEGNNSSCTEFKNSKNPLFILNYELLKRNNIKNAFKLLTTLRYSNFLTQKWNGVHILSPSLSSITSSYAIETKCLKNKDIYNLNSLYFVNACTQNLPNFKKIINLNLFKKSFNNFKLIFDQNYKNNNNMEYLKNSNYIYIPSSIFYENEETFLNALGHFKKAYKIIFKKNKNNWQILRRITKLFNKFILFFNYKNNKFILLNSKNTTNFKNCLYFLFQAVKTLTSLNYYLSNKTNSFIIPNNVNFKKQLFKIINTKLKYLIDDFFNDGKDEYSPNSLTLSYYSKKNRLTYSNFLS